MTGVQTCALPIYYVSARQVTPDMINDLASLGPNILRLNLRHAGITDAEVAFLNALAEIRNLCEREECRKSDVLFLVRE